MMGMSIEKMYGSYSDADLNDWERFPLNASVLTSSAFGAWLLRRDERRDKAIPKADYEARLKADMVAILEELKEQLREMHEDYFETEHFDEAYGVSVSMDTIQQKINKLKGEK